VRDAIDELRAADVEPFGVNEADAESHQAFIDAFGFPFELLVDEGFGVARAYGAMKPEGSGIKRTVVVVGKDGRILFRREGAPAPSEILAAVREAGDE
jgi:peroxiredoxin